MGNTPQSGDGLWDALPVKEMDTHSTSMMIGETGEMAHVRTQDAGAVVSVLSKRGDWMPS